MQFVVNGKLAIAAQIELDIGMRWRQLSVRIGVDRRSRLDHRTNPWPETSSGLEAPVWRDKWGRRALALLLVLLSGAGIALAFGFDAPAAIEVLRRNHLGLLTFVAGAPHVASLLFMAIYAIGVAISVPGLAVLTVIGGYLFGWVHGTAYALIAATFAASAMFLLARSAIGGALRARAGPSLQRFAQGFRDNASSYVFVLNLVPIFPYAMVIGIPAACGVRLRTFTVSAFFGLLPGTLLFAHLGTGLGDVLAANLPIRLTSFTTPHIVLPLTGLAILTLLPVAYRSWRSGRSA
jgi:uncharacterized membrane protein YdjX (TVP38/TMEM64 family)